MNKAEYLELKSWAVVGDVLNPEKYAYRILQKLGSRGYTVTGVHPQGGEGIYTDLSTLPSKPDVVCLVINPRSGVEFLREAATLGIKNAWLQPGADTEAVLAACKELGLNHIQNCVLVALG